MCKIQSYTVAHNIRTTFFETQYCNFSILYYILVAHKSPYGDEILPPTAVPYVRNMGDDVKSSSSSSSFISTTSQNWHNIGYSKFNIHKKHKAKHSRYQKYYYKYSKNYFKKAAIETASTHTHTHTHK